MGDIRRLLTRTKRSKFNNGYVKFLYEDKMLHVEDTMSKDDLITIVPKSQTASENENTDIVVKYYEYGVSDFDLKESLKSTQKAIVGEAKVKDNVLKEKSKGTLEKVILEYKVDSPDGITVYKSKAIRDHRQMVMVMAVEKITEHLDSDTINELDKTFDSIQL